MYEYNCTYLTNMFVCFTNFSMYTKLNENDFSHSAQCDQSPERVLDCKKAVWICEHYV
jgi:hypothetical protein